jgi:serine/threonine-protein kinase RsbT
VTAPGTQDAGTEAVQPIASSDDVVRARQLARSFAVDCKLSLVDQTKLVTAASELARNTLVHGGGGSMSGRLLRAGNRSGVALRFEDRGPGIPDVDLAMTDGWSSGTGLGLGLSGTRRLVDEFEIETAPGVGTTVSVVKWSH